MELLQNTLIRLAVYGEGPYGAGDYGREVEEGIGGILPKTGIELILAGLFFMASLSCLFYVYFRRQQLRALRR